MRKSEDEAEGSLGDGRNRRFLFNSGQLYQPLDAVLCNCVNTFVLAMLSLSLRKYLIFFQAVSISIGLQVILDHWRDEIHDFLHGAAPSHDQSAHQSTHLASATHVPPSIKMDYERV